MNDESADDNIIQFPTESARREWKLRGRRTHKELVMNTKRVTYANGYSFEIRPFGNKLQAQAAVLLKKRHGLEFNLQATSLEAALYLKLINAELIIVKGYASGSDEVLPTERVVELLSTYDTLGEWIVSEGTKFNTELQESWGKEAKN